MRTLEHRTNNTNVRIIRDAIKCIYFEPTGAFDGICPQASADKWYANRPDGNADGYTHGGGP